jgi:glycosyltransferase involved in cell wall biosynthesis
LNIAILHYACAPTIGGVESIMSTHARLLEQYGHRPFILAGRGDPESVGLRGVIVPEIDSKHPDIVRVQHALHEDEAAALPEFERWVERISDRLLPVLEGVDVCIVHNVFTLHKNLPLTVALARMAEHRRGPKGWIAWCHDLAWNNPLYANDLLPRWPWTPLKYPLPNVNYVAISERRRVELSGLFRVPLTDIALVPNGIDPTSYVPTSPAMARVRDLLRWDDRDWVLLAPLRVTRRKNLELGIDVIAAMKGMGASPLLVITGPLGPHNVRSGEYMDELLHRREAKGVKDEVVFLALEGGPAGEDGEREGLEVSDALMVELYWWADALFVPSQQEGFGLPLLEAALARLPVFCSNLPVLREVGRENATYFQPDDDPEIIADTILDELSQLKTANHRRKVLSTYNWDHILKSSFLPLLEEITNDECSD